MKGKQKETCSNRKSIQRSVFSIDIKGQSLMEKNNKGEKLTESSLSVVTWCELLMSEWYGLSGSKRSAVSFRYSLTESSQFGHPTYFHSLYLFTHFCHFLRKDYWEKRWDDIRYVAGRAHLCCIYRNHIGVSLCTVIDNLDKTTIIEIMLFLHIS